jgi:hypothetical protein
LRRGLDVVPASIDRHLLMKASRLPFIFGTAVLITGCYPFTGVCTTDIRYGIVVEVRDAVSGAVVADGARLIVREGEYVETVDGPPVPGLPYLQAAAERPGTYSVTVEKAAYQVWTRTDIRVRDTDCHVSTVRLEARLQPTS